MSNLEKTDIRLGYVPLLDCIAILWAKHQGYFADLGLNVTLIKEASWASLRDRLAFGFLDAAHCLSAMLPAATLGADQLGIPFQTPLILSNSPTAISLSQKLCFELNITADDAPESSANKVAYAIHQHQNIRLAHVFQHSIHHYCLKEWLALADSHTEYKLKLLTLPPPYMVEAISKQLIDGFCVGEPWNIQAELEGLSTTVCSGQQFAPQVANKVFAVTQEWAAQHPKTLNALCQAIIKAQNELQTLESIDDVWDMLIEYNIIRFNCSKFIHVQSFHKIQNIIQNLVPQDVRPKASDFEWMIHQMQKWDNLEINDQKIGMIAKQCIVAI
ncbi:CmpA/NrtA family ABC transporter substrate-binding protein [Acinetobacter sp. P8-3-8]|uniref:CmpA/NrtA family ABC transporter substrate-binding protein n=1 Tax=Acinetobacter sp. P8-3-8 TaxID=1029823 RepID=UPI0002485939|nr:CmpA/NrtA family ABC transporter substrate-binding protein [Acinetobacter sp. P8-3-8]